MINPGVLIIFGLLLALTALALVRRDGTLQSGLIRGVEQVITLIPRMFCALVGAGFLVQLIPTTFISGLLGAEAGPVAIVVGAIAGTIIPAGPVISFSVAAVLANEGASVPALVAFITSWSVLAAHRIIIFEIPLLGLSFLRLRVLSVVILPLLAGGLAFAATSALSMLDR